MALIKKPEEIEILKQGGKILAEILETVATNVRAGISTWELDEIASKEIKKSGAKPAFPGYKIAPDMPAFPGALCTSVDAEVVHGIPKKDRILKEGQIIGLDLGIKYQGLYTDAAVTVPVGKIDSKKQMLIDVTRQALSAGIMQVKSGNTLGDIGYAIQSSAERAGLGVIRDLGGHGVGHAIHEHPFVPNFGRPGTLAKLKAGMVLAIEPMLTTGDWRIKFQDDGWTVVTTDGSLAAHFEHTVAVTASGYEILTG